MKQKVMFECRQLGITNLGGPSIYEPAVSHREKIFIPFEQAATEKAKTRIIKTTAGDRVVERYVQSADYDEMIVRHRINQEKMRFRFTKLKKF